MSYKNSSQAELVTAARAALAQEREPKKLTKKALLESLLPELEAAVLAGKSKEQMHRNLLEIGIDIPFNTFRKYVSELLDTQRLAIERRDRGQLKSKVFNGINQSTTAPRGLRSMRSTLSQSQH